MIIALSLTRKLYRMMVLPNLLICNVLDFTLVCPPVLNMRSRLRHIPLSSSCDPALLLRFSQLVVPESYYACYDSCAYNV